MPNNFAVGGANSRKDDEERDTSDHARGEKISGLNEMGGDSGGGDGGDY